MVGRSNARFEKCMDDFGSGDSITVVVLLNGTLRCQN